MDMATVTNRAKPRAVPLFHPLHMRLPLVAAMLACASAAQGQSLGEAPASGGSGPRFRPQLTVSQVWTDNLRTDGSAQASVSYGPKDAALVTTVSPGFSYSTNASGLRTSIDYSLSAIGYVKANAPSRLQNSLSARGSIELIQQFLTVDATASAGQQAASAFGTQSADAGISAANRREVLNASISPTLRSHLGDFADLLMRVEEQRTEVRGTGQGDGRGRTSMLRLDSRGSGAMRVFALISQRRGQFQGALNSNVDSQTVGLNYRPDVDWTLSLNGGRERSDVVTATAGTGSTWGTSANWAPDARTQLNADWQKHAYGNTHTLSFEHRMRLVSFRFIDSAGLNQGYSGSGGRQTNFDLYYQLFASREPDPLKRADYVRNYLQSMGLPADGVVGGGLLTTSPNRQRQQQFGMTLLSVRSTLSVMLGRTQTQRVGPVATGDLALSPDIAQRTYSISAAHKLTPTSSLSLTANRSSNQGQGVSQFTSLDSYMAGWSIQLGARANAQLGLRHSRSQGVFAYSENSVTASMTQQF